MGKLPFTVINNENPQSRYERRLQRIVSQPAPPATPSKPEPKKAAPAFGKTTNEAKGFRFKY